MDACFCAMVYTGERRWKNHLLHSVGPMNNPSNHIVVFTLDEQRYALHLLAVERVVRAVEVTALPEAPEIVLGVVNVKGRIVPVINVRRRFRLPERN